ncbi:stage V sporulation protein AA [Metabacillus sp. GX 13764]|uniref:stage V sporulation protein AA n=1 Tax=Metabacillus kandeliae TaxID=2900151 RepID=UPI001E5338EB|nr:stage V sporulation protein AA [Metabacillus kandeliae]MCD7033294.1 stage V sporulation protein AA [Metabacillus kandeliae]
MDNTLYIRLRHRIQVYPEDELTIGKIAQLAGDRKLMEKAGGLIIHKITPSDKNMVVVDVMKAIKLLKREMPGLDVQPIGASQTIVEIVYEKKPFKPLLFVLVWLILFIGAAMAIMNFHEDVSMQAVHQRLYRILTGKTSDSPLLLQIPYSLGLGLGMILFFNHLFKKRINEEPSPLEVEMFKYQLDLDQYVAMNENRESVKEIEDD